MIHPSEIGSRYEVLQSLGAGGMGAVFKVRDRRLKRVLVAKTILAETSSPQEQRELRERFRREAELASQLAHPNIVQIFDLVPEGPWIVMEFVEGPTLRDLLAQGPLAIGAMGLTLEIARQALRALRYLHARGAIHRDVAPDNLMLTRDAEGAPLVKMIDLGIARSVSDDGLLTGKGVFLGKPSYASPEHLRALEPPGVASDIFSFGVVLYELLTGYHPFAGRASRRSQHPAPLGFEVSDPTGRIPDDLRAILWTALEEEPRRRFQSAEELASRLAAVQARFPCEAAEVDAVLGPFSLGPEVSFLGAKGGEVTRPSLDRISLVHPVTPSTPRPAAVVVRKRTPPKTEVETAERDVFSRRMAQSLALTALLLVLFWPIYQRLPSPPRRPAAPVSSPMAPAPRPSAPPAAVRAVAPPVPAPAETPQPVEPQPVPQIQKVSNVASRGLDATRAELVGGGDFFETEPAVLVSVPKAAAPDVRPGAGAEVVIGFWVDTTGAVSDARVELSHVKGRAPASPFEESALEAARKARFRPAQRKGSPVYSWNTLTFTFETP